MREKNVYPFFHIPKQNIPIKKKLADLIDRTYCHTPVRKTKVECYDDMIESIKKVIKEQ